MNIGRLLQSIRAAAYCETHEYCCLHYTQPLVIRLFLSNVADADPFTNKSTNLYCLEWYFKALMIQEHT
jgi:hypothetical protein